MQQTKNATSVQLDEKEHEMSLQMDEKMEQIKRLHGIIETKKMENREILEQNEQLSA